jgi:type I restriction enzyme S subunit
MIGLYDTAAFNMSINNFECACNQAILYSKLNDDFYTLFVYYTLFISKDYYLSKRKGARQKNLSSTFIKNIEIIFPKLNNGKILIEKFNEYFQLYFSLKTDKEKSLQNLEEIFDSILTNSFKHNQVNTIDEEPIFKELIKKFTLEDLKGNKKRLQFLINLFDSKVFDDLDDYSNAKEKLFQLIEEDQIIQELTNNNLKLKVK